MKNRIVFLLLIVTLLLGNPFMSWATDEEEIHEFSGPTWNYGGPPSDTHWSPWLPPAHFIVRGKIGARFSPFSINMKCPMKVTLKYNPADVKAGSRFKLKVKAEPIAPEEGKAFESAFGLYLPSALQVGFVGVSGLPDDLLPWFDIDYNLWDLLGFIPKFGSQVVRLRDQIGVNMDSVKDNGNNTLPLGSSKEYHDTRTLINLTEDVAGDDVIKTSMVNKIYSKIPDSAINTLKVFMSTDSIKGKLGSGVDKIAKLASLAIEGDPYFKVEGQRIELMLWYSVPGKTYGTMPLTITSSSQWKEFEIHIPYFASTSDTLQIAVTDVGYHFKLYQTLNFQVNFSLFPDLDLIDSTNTVTQKTITQSVGQDEFKTSIPILQNDEAAGDYHVHMGSVSATMFFGSRDMPLIGVVDVWGPNNFHEVFSESTPIKAHAIPITGLEAETDYTFQVKATDQQGNLIATSEILSGRTKALSDSLGTNEKMSQGSSSMYNIVATPNKNKIDFTWETSVPASTEIFVSSVPDIRSDYVSYVKKSGGVTAGYFDAVEGDRELETIHSITVPNRLPDTLYYYIVRSYTFKDDDPVKNPGGLLTLGYVGNTRTLPMFLPATLKVLAKEAGNPVGYVPVTVTKVGNVDYLLALSTKQTGYTDPISLERGSRYKFSVLNHQRYENMDSSVLAVSQSAEGELPDVVLNLTPKPSPGGYVYNVSGNSISGATVTCDSLDAQTTTDSNGHYVFENPRVYGTVFVTVSKDKYVTKAITASTNYGLFSAPECILAAKPTTLSITAKTNPTTPLSGAVVELKEDGVPFGDLRVTNTQGQASITYDFQDDLTHEVVVKIKPQGVTNIPVKEETVSVQSGETKDIVVLCETDTRAPVISNVSIKQLESLKCEVSFDTDEEGAIGMVEYRLPTGGLSYDSWTTGTSTSGSGTTHHVHLKEWSYQVAGTHQVNVKAKDTFGNESQSDFRDFVLFGGDMWNLRAENITMNSVAFKWDKYPYQEEFAKYVIEGRLLPTTEITDRNTTSFTLENLNPKSLYGLHISAKNTQGQELATPTAIEIWTAAEPKPPVITTIQGGSMIPDTVTLNSRVIPVFSVNDPEGNISALKVILHRMSDGQETIVYEKKEYKTNQILNEGQKSAFTASEAGAFKLIVTAEDESGLSASREKEFTVAGTEEPSWEIYGTFTPSPVMAGRECTRKIRVINYDKLSGDASILVYWKDGTGSSTLSRVATKEENVQNKLEEFTTITHTYRNPGEYELLVWFTLETKDKTYSGYLSEMVMVIRENPEITLTKDETRNKANEQSFYIKATEGAYPIASWTLNFGDRHEPDAAVSGSGPTEQNVTHTYMRTTKVFKGNSPYEAKFTVTDSNGGQEVKTVQVYIDNSIQEPRPEGTITKTQGGLTGTDLGKHSEDKAEQKTSAKADEGIKIKEEESTRKAEAMQKKKELEAQKKLESQKKAELEAEKKLEAQKKKELEAQKKSEELKKKQELEAQKKAELEVQKKKEAEAEAKIATEMKIKFQNAIKSVSKVKSAKELEKLKIDTTGWSAKDKALLKNAIEEKKKGLENESKKE